MKGVLSTADYLNAKIRVECSENETTNSFTINGIDMDGNTISETIQGANGTSVEGSKVFKKVTSITAASNTTGKIMIGTVVGDSSWIAQIDANSLNADTSQEISNELIKELRKKSPTSLLNPLYPSGISSNPLSLPSSFKNIALRQGYTASWLSNSYVTSLSGT